MPQTFVKIIIIGLLSGLGSVTWADVVVVVSEKSPIQALTSTQLTDIYLGRLTRLPEAGSVVPVDQVEQSNTHHDFYQQYLGRTPAQIRAHWSRLIFTGRGQPPKAVESDAAMAEALRRNPSAIGYMDSETLPEGMRVIDIES
ncbi:hypothetical protein [Marinimicrobium agarilyticum]|uniref:hypothetical protein n=1 Tax=Marinimicrobium agarilyticum TaxID=306546 RepID=UPI000567E41B|nr:hypothetical protein [Marinimicrobium agarilyticum]